MGFGIFSYEQRVNFTIRYHARDFLGKLIGFEPRGGCYLGVIYRKRKVVDATQCLTKDAPFAWNTDPAVAGSVGDREKVKR